MRQADGAKRVGIWIRVSTDLQVKDESPEHHERRARLYAESKGWNVVEVYQLDAISGKTVKETPQAKRMIEAVRSGHISGLIFSKLARLARNTRELLEFAEIFQECGADLVSLAEAIDTSTPAGRLFFTMIAAMAQWEREEIAQRVSASVPIRAQLGKPLGGQAPFGYKWEDKKLVVDPTEAPVRKLLYELFNEQRRKKTVARLLNERGYRTRSGAPFSDTTVDRLIRDPTAKGIRRANYTKSTGDGKAWEVKPESEWVLHPVEAIVPESLWTSCNAFLDDQRAKGKRSTKPVAHLFSGIAHCACGKKMYVPANSPRYTCYPCKNRMPVADLEMVFREQIKGLFFSPTEVAAYLEQANQAIQAKAELLSVLETEQGSLTTEIDKLYDLYQSSAINKDLFARKYQPLEKRSSEIENELPQLRAELDVLRINHLSQEDIISNARNLYDRWPELAVDEKRRIAESVVERIVIGEGEIEFAYLYAPPPPSPSQVSQNEQHLLRDSLPPPAGSWPESRSGAPRGKP
ncbi:MAG: recombinase family protein [Nevskia sp.]|nr:recombinase family protein [Nevskia sp.]